MNTTMEMFYDKGAMTVPRNFKIGDEEAHGGPRSPSAYDKGVINDLKFSLDRALLDNRTSSDRHSSRRSRYDPRRNTTGVTEYELSQRSISKYLYAVYYLSLNLNLPPSRSFKVIDISLWY